MFDTIIISEEVGYQKPSPEIFEVLFNKFEVKNEKLIFIDDTEKSLEKSKEIGFVPILFRSNEKLKEELFKFLSKDK